MVAVEAEELLMDRVDLDHILIDALLGLNHDLSVDLAEKVHLAKHQLAVSC